MAPAAPAQDYYLVLEVSPTALLHDIKASYRRLARLHHPDKNIGCSTATAKIQLINEAWEILSDVSKRFAYDLTRPHCIFRETAPTTPSTSTPKSAAPTSRPSTTVREDAKAHNEGREKRQQWLNFERTQEDLIRQCRNRIKTLEAEVAALVAKIKVNQVKLANADLYQRNAFADASKRLSEDAKNTLRRESLDSEAAIRIKSIPLDKEKVRLDVLQEELARRRSQEETRIRPDTYQREAKERQARANAAAAAQQKAEQEILAREAQKRAAREKAAREWEQARAARAAHMVREAQRAREQAAKDAERRAAEETRAKAVAEAIIRCFAEEKKRMEEQRDRTERQRSKRNNIQNNNKKKKKAWSEFNTEHSVNHGMSNRVNACDHSGWWIKVQGRHDCAHCTRPLFKFAEQCPGCSTKACASCRAMLKRGETPQRIDTYSNGRASSSFYSKRRSDSAHYSNPAGYDDDFDWD